MGHFQIFRFLIPNYPPSMQVRPHVYWKALIKISLNGICQILALLKEQLFLKIMKNTWWTWKAVLLSTSSHTCRKELFGSEHWIEPKLLKGQGKRGWWGRGGGKGRVWLVFFDWGIVRLVGGYIWGKFWCLCKVVYETNKKKHFKINTSQESKHFVGSELLNAKDTVQHFLEAENQDEHGYVVQMQKADHHHPPPPPWFLERTWNLGMSMLLPGLLTFMFTSLFTLLYFWSGDVVMQSLVIINWSIIFVN